MRCEHCGYKLIDGQCPIPCKGKPLLRPEDVLVDAGRLDVTTGGSPVTYWTPKAA